MKKYHLIGENIKSSLSPLIHNFLFQYKGFSSKQYQYSIYDKENCLLTLNNMKKQNIKGISITIPFKQSYSKDIQSGLLKQQIFKDLDQFNLNEDNQSQIIRAQQILEKRRIINTIKMCQQINNKVIFKCFNTDIFGVRQCFKQNICFNFIINNKKQLQNSIGIIIGGGATCQVFMSYFKQLNIETIVINRSIQKVYNLKKDYYPNILKVISFNKNKQENKYNSQQYMSKIKKIQNIIIINTLPTSILKQNLFNNNSIQFNSILNQLSNQSSKQLSNQSSKQLFNQLNIKNIFYMDVNYRDKQQTLLKFINKNNHLTSSTKLKIHQISNGLNMLIWQAILQNHIFTQPNLNTQSNKSIQLNFNNQFKQLINILTQSNII